MDEKIMAEMPDIENEDLSDLSEYHDSDDENSSCDNFQGFGSDNFDGFEAADPENSQNMKENDDDNVCLNDLGMSPIRTEIESRSRHSSGESFEGFCEIVAEKNNSVSTLKQSELVGHTQQLKSSKNFQEIVTPVRVKTEIDTDMVGPFCDLIGCNISWLESGEVKVANITNGVVYELTEFAKRIAWSKEYIGEWILRLRGYPSGTMETSSEDLRKINFVSKRRKALTVTFASSVSTTFRTKLNAFDCEIFILPSELVLKEKNPSNSVEILKSDSDIRNSVEFPVKTPENKKSKRVSVSAVTTRANEDSCEMDIVTTKSVIMNNSVKKTKPKATIIDKNFKKYKKILEAVPPLTDPGIKFGSNIKFASKQGKNDKVGKEISNPIFEERDNIIGPYCSDSQVDVVTLNNLPDRAHCLTKGMIFEMYIFFKERGATLTSLVHKLYSLIKWEINPDLIKTELGNIQHLVNTPVPDDIDSFFSTNFTLYGNRSAETPNISTTNEELRSDTCVKTVQKAAEIELTKDSTTTNNETKDNAPKVSGEEMSINNDTEDGSTLIDESVNVDKNMKPSNIGKAAVTRKSVGRGRKRKCSIESIPSPAINLDENKKPKTIPSKIECTNEKVIDPTIVDANKCLGKDGMITRGDIVKLYCIWLEKKNLDKDSVFVIDLLNDVETLMLSRGVSIVRIPVGMLMSSSVRLLEEYQSYKKENEEDALAYLVEDWLEDITSLQSTSNKPNPSQTAESSIDATNSIELTKNEQKIKNTEGSSSIEKKSIPGSKRPSEDGNVPKPKKVKITEKATEFKDKKVLYIEDAISRINFVDMTFNHRIVEIKSVRVSSDKDSKVYEYLATWKSINLEKLNSCSADVDTWVQESSFPSNCDFIINFWKEANPKRIMKIQEILYHNTLDDKYTVLWEKYKSKSILSFDHVKEFQKAHNSMNCSGYSIQSDENFATVEKGDQMEKNRLNEGEDPPTAAALLEISANVEVSNDLHLSKERTVSAENSDQEAMDDHPSSEDVEEIVKDTNNEKVSSSKEFISNAESANGDLDKTSNHSKFDDEKSSAQRESCDAIEKLPVKDSATSDKLVNSPESEVTVPVKEDLDCKATSESERDALAAFNDVILMSLSDTLAIEKAVPLKKYPKDKTITNQQILDIYNEWREKNDENKTVNELRKSVKSLMRKNGRELEYKYDDCLMGVCFQMYTRKMKITTVEELEEFNTMDCFVIFGEFKRQQMKKFKKEDKNKETNVRLANLWKSKVLFSEVTKIGESLKEDIVVLTTQIKLIEEKTGSMPNVDSKLVESLAEMKNGLKLLESEKLENQEQILSIGRKLEEEISLLSKLHTSVSQ